MNSNPELEAKNSRNPRGKIYQRQKKLVVRKNPSIYNEYVWKAAKAITGPSYRRKSEFLGILGFIGAGKGSVGIPFSEKYSSRFYIFLGNIMHFLKLFRVDRGLMSVERDLRSFDLGSAYGEIKFKTILQLQSFWPYDGKLHRSPNITTVSSTITTSSFEYDDHNNTFDDVLDELCKNQEDI